MSYNSIKPGQVWLDTEGKPIQAHGFSVFYSEKDETYYWYGENKEKTVGGPDNKIWHWGMRCYASKDLYNWEDKGLIIPPAENDLTSPLHPTYGVDRPHIIYCEKTGKYVAWLKVMANTVSQFMTIMQADDFLGPYEIVHEMYKPFGMDSGDFTLVKDEKTGKGYFIYERPHFELVTATLSDTYTEVVEYSEHFDGLYPPFTREAPSYMERNGKKYLFTSGTTGYYPNRSKVCTFDDFHGEYTDLGDPHVDDESGTSFGSQITCVLKVPGTELYIALADRWVPGFDTKEQMEKMEKMFSEEFADYVPDRSFLEAAPMGGEWLPHPENTSIATYVWLPIEWDGDMPRIRWYDEWKIEDFI